MSERSIFRNRISCDNCRFAYHGIDLPITRVVSVVHFRSKAAHPGGWLFRGQINVRNKPCWSGGCGSARHLTSYRAGKVDPRSIIVLADTIIAPLVALRLVRGHVPPSHLEIPTKAASTFSALPPDPQPCPRRRGGHRRRQALEVDRWRRDGSVRPSWDPQTSRRRFRFV